MTDTFSKTVAIKAVDEEERTATGAVLVPNEVDRQRDFLAPAGVERMYAPDPDDGVMHSAFPEGAAELVRNEVVDEPIELNGETYPAGTWVATRKYNDGALWQLVSDDVLDGFSIGGEVGEVREYGSAEALPDEVTFPAEVEPGPATEIVDGGVEEVSDVDIPAVPRATYRELGKLGKGITDEVDGREEFVEVMEGRGHDPADARRLWRYLQREGEKASDERAESRTDTDDTDDMTDTTTDTTDDSADADAGDGTAKGDTVEDVDDATLGARIKSALGIGGGSDDGSVPEAPEGDTEAEKAGRTLSQRNRRAVMASVDAQLDILNDAGVDHGMTRFSDRAEFAFDIEEYGKEEHTAGNDGGEEMDKNAPGGDTPDDDMTDENIEEKVDSLEEKLDALVEKFDETDDTEKEDEQDDNELADKVDALTEKVDALNERVDKVSKASADTQQAGGSEQTGDGGEDLDKTERQKRELFFGGN